MQTSKVLNPGDTILIYITNDCPLEWCEYFIKAFPNNNVVVIPSNFVDHIVTVTNPKEPNKTEMELPF